MDIKELTDQLVASSENYNQRIFIPWWEANHEEFIYHYNIMEEETVQAAQACLAECGKEDLLSPVGKMGLTLFHLLVWHNFYGPVEEMLRDGRVPEADVPDGKGHGLTPFLLACSQGNLAMVRLLLAHGAKDSLWDDRGMNAYHFLAYPRFEELGIDIDALSASVDQRAEIARLLTCDINKKNNKGFTPLEHLLSTEYSSGYTWPLTEIFLEKGASTDYVDEDGNTLLMMARRHGHYSAALQLMRHCPELVNVPNNQGVTPIQHAVDFQSHAMYFALIDHGAEAIPNELAAQFPLSQIVDSTFFNVQHDNKDCLSLGLYMAEKLIRQTDPDDDDEMGDMMEILSSALRSDEEAKVLDLYKAAGMDFTSPIYYHGEKLCLRDQCIRASYDINHLRKLMALGVDLDEAVVNGETPAYILAFEDKGWKEPFLEEATKLFSKESMEQTARNGEAAVHLAAKYGHVGMLKIMIEKGVDINLTNDSSTDGGMTPLHIACLKGHTDMVKILIAAGADDTIKTLNGDTPAHIVLRKDRWGKELELEQKAAILKELHHLDLPDANGRTPLMMLRYSTEKLLPLFLERGVDVNRRDNRGMTALMLALSKDIAKELLRAGADLNLADHDGNTALHHALLEYDESTARYLVKKGADYNRPNNEGTTSVQLALERNFESVLDFMTDIV